MSGGHMRKIERRDAELQELDEEALQAGRLKVSADRAKELAKEHKIILLNLLKDQQSKGHTHRVGFDDDRAVIVSLKEKYNGVDPEKLKKAMGAPAFNKLTSAHLDQGKLEAAIALGHLDPNVVSACMKPVTEYVDVRFGKRRKGST